LHPKAKFIVDILKLNDKTKFIGEGHKLYQNTLTVDILKENDKTKLISKGNNGYHKTDKIGGGVLTLHSLEITLMTTRDPAIALYSMESVIMI
jgi:hypothetical protein